MSKINLVLLGSNTAKAGFKNEDDIVLKFKDWNNDLDSQEWLQIMGYKLINIEKVEAIKLFRKKADIQVQIKIYLKDAISAENLSIKLVSNPQGFNQVDKRKVDKYIEMWDIPIDVSNILKLFTGETVSKREDLIDQRRMFLTEMTEDDRIKIINFFNKIKILVISDIIKGRDQFSADWMLVALIVGGVSKWVLKSINQAMQIFGDGPVEITKKGSLKIGKVTMQRKGGDAGRDSAKMLQFKINPVLLFEIQR